MSRLKAGGMKWAPSTWRNRMREALYDFLKEPHDVLSYRGGGRVSVRVVDILNSPKVQRQVEAVRRLQRTIKRTV